MTPMQLTTGVKTAVVLFLIVGALTYALLLEFAINAGRVHRGVSVEGYDIGGLNYAEARDALNDRGTELKDTAMVFAADGVECEFSPADIGWGPQPSDTADLAMEVGRDGGVIDALRERFTAWTDGVRIEWAGSPAATKVGRALNRCEKQAEEAGLQIDRPKLRHTIKKAIVTWPRPHFTIPLVQ